MAQDYQNVSQEISAAHERQRAAHRTESEVVPSLIGQPETIDAWRHRRMYEGLTSLVDASQSWLTIGDSGADAFWLSSQGVENITASSITDHQLRNLQARGALDGVEIREINAEQIDLPNDAVDFTMCKEAFHHFARPMVGLYEMLRVSRRGVVLLAEPLDDGRKRPLDSAKTLIKRTLRRNTAMANDMFETAGNYIYGVSLREMHKAAIALQLADLRYLPLNDFFHQKVSRNMIDHTTSRLVTKTAIKMQDVLTRTGLMSWGSLTVILLKQPLEEPTSEGLNKAGFKTCSIPQNPYIGKH